MLHKKQRSHLRKLIGRKLKKGERISVYGWNESDHNKKTRSYRESGKIEFVKRGSGVNVITGDFVILTSVCTHADQLLVKKECSSVFSKTVDVQILKKILRKCL